MGIELKEFLQIINGFGKYQKLLDLLFSLMVIPCGYSTLVMYFAALNPKWKCTKNSTVCIQNGTFAKDDAFRCQIPRSEWDYIEPQEYSIVTQFDLVCDREWGVYMSTSIFFIGWIMGALFLGWVSDNYGRKKVMFVSFTAVVLGGFASSFSTNLAMFLVLRFISGIFRGGTIFYVTITEMVSDKKRSFAGNMIWLSFTIALCAMGLKAYFIRTCKTLLIVTTVPYLLFLLTYNFVPESIQWLRAKGRVDEALKILQKIARWNGKELDPKLSLAPIKAGGINRVSPVDLFHGREMAIKTLAQGFVWMVNGMVYYGIALAADDLGGSLYLNFVLVSLVEFPAVIIAIVCLNRFGRKKTTIISLFLSGIVCLCVPAIPLSSGVNLGRVCLGMMGKMFITISFDGVFLWSAELYPTSIRSQGFGFLRITSRIGAAAAPWIAKAVKVFHPSLPFIIMGGLGLLSGATCFFLPETLGVEMKATVQDNGDNGEKIELKDQNIIS